MLEDKILSFALMGGGWVLWLLVGLSVLCLAVTVERLIYGWLHRSRSRTVERALQAFLQGGELESFASRIQAQRGLEARVFHAGVQATQDGDVSAGEEAIAGTLLLEKCKLERGLIVLGTAGANAPFIGLFGTVLGIIRAFHDLSLDAEESVNAVMAGISEALVATAAGLLVAIPAVVLYNAFQRRNRDQVDRVQSLSHLMLSRIRSASAGA